MIELVVRWLPFRARAMTLWPFVLYLPHAYGDRCTQVHERYHWKQALRWGVIPWYVAYLVLAVFYRKAERHPLERPAYAVQRKCQAVWQPGMAFR